MEKEKFFLYCLFSSLYRNGCKRIDISQNKQFLEYLKSMLDDDCLKEIASIFICDENGIYINYLTLINELDPLIVERHNNALSIVMDTTVASIFSDEDIDYIGEKMATYVKIKEKEKEYYARN